MIGLRRSFLYSAKVERFRTEDLGENKKARNFLFVSIESGRNRSLSEESLASAGIGR